jgi:hypothetical protein
MTPFERTCLHASAALAALTGLLYGWLKYFGARAGEFGPEAHPWQGSAQHLHVLVVPVLVFTLGGLFRAHFLPMWRSGKAAGRFTGSFLVLGLLPMVLSGYAVQVAVDPIWRAVFAWIHGVASLAFLAGFSAHLGRTWRERAAERKTSDGLAGPE